MAFTPTYSPVAPNATLGGQGYGRMQDITMDAVSAYPAGGFALTGCGIQTILGVAHVGNNTAGVGYIPAWNSQTSKLQILVSGASASPLIEFVGTFAASTVIRGWIIGY